MFPAATLFLDVCVQRDFWPGGAWPLVNEATARNVGRLHVIAAASQVRRGGIICRHGTADTPAAAGVPLHCCDADEAVRPVGCGSHEPAAHWMATGCARSPDEAPHDDAFRQLTAGVRDVVVFGAGVEYGVAHTIDALLRRRLRTHLVMDAAAAVSDVAAQLAIAAWKRRGVDVLTTDIVARLLTAG